MVLPIIAGAMAVQGLASLAELYQSEKAKKANQAKLDEIKDAFDAIKPPEYDMSVMDPPQLITEKIPESAFNFTKLKPEQFKLVGKYAPDLAPHIAEQNPQLAQQTELSKEAKGSQQEALRGLMQRAKGESPSLAIKLDQAAKKSSAAAHSNQQSILESAARRGQLGAGSTLAAQLQGAEGAMERGSQESQNAAIAAEQEALQALMQGGQIGGQVAGQEFNEQSRNADVINQFNARTSRDMNEFLQRRQDIQNQAQQANLASQQGVANMNTQASNQFATGQQSREDELLGRNRQERVGERGFANQTAQQQYDNSVNERNHLNTLKGQTYQNQLQQQAGRQGLGQMQMGMNTQNVQDRNAAVQGLSNIGVGAMKEYGSSQAADQANNQANQRSYFETYGRKPKKGEYGYIDEEA